MADTTTTVSFASDIKPYLQQYLAQMRWRFDLTDYDQVKTNAALIYGRIESKTMPPPPFAPFSDEFIAAFKAWMKQDCPP
jgi:hypothetical protein